MSVYIIVSIMFYNYYYRMNLLPLKALLAAVALVVLLDPLIALKLESAIPPNISTTGIKVISVVITSNKENNKFPQLKSIST